MNCRATEKVINMKEKIKQYLVDFLKFFIIAAVAVLLIFLMSFMPKTELMGTTLAHFLNAVVTVTAVITCTAVTGKMFGAALPSFGLPVLTYFFIGLFSPIFIAPHIFANFMMVFFYNILGKKKKNHIHRGISYLVAGLVRFGFIFIFSKVGEKFIEYIMIFKNVTDEAGLSQAVNDMLVDSYNGQLVATILGLLVSYGVAMLFISLSKKKV